MSNHKDCTPEQIKFASESIRESEDERILAELHQLAADKKDLLPPYAAEDVALVKDHGLDFLANETEAAQTKTEKPAPQGDD